MVLIFSTRAFDLRRVFALEVAMNVELPVLKPAG
jgi:hypothetical protein